MLPVTAINSLGYQLSFTRVQPCNVRLRISGGRAVFAHQDRESSHGADAHRSLDGLRVGLPSLLAEEPVNLSLSCHGQVPAPRARSVALDSKG